MAAGLVAARMRVGHMPNNANNNIDDASIATLRRLVSERGTVGAARQLGIDRSALIRVLAGLAVRRGTVALIRLGIIPP